jgi:hypothetical protein
MRVVGVVGGRGRRLAFGVPLPVVRHMLGSNRLAPVGRAWALLLAFAATAALVDPAAGMCVWLQKNTCILVPAAL